MTFLVIGRDRSGVGRSWVAGGRDFQSRAEAARYAAQCNREAEIHKTCIDYTVEANRPKGGR